MSEGTNPYNDILPVLLFPLCKVILSRMLVHRLSLPHERRISSIPYNKIIYASLFVAQRNPYLQYTTFCFQNMFLDELETRHTV